ncbi:MAG: hypothetical protein ACOCP8_03880 [archaeon]
MKNKLQSQDIQKISQNLTYQAIHEYLSVRELAKRIQKSVKEETEFEIDLDSLSEELRFYGYYGIQPSMELDEDNKNKVKRDIARTIANFFDVNMFGEIGKYSEE